jgi:subtilisin
MTMLADLLRMRPDDLRQGELSLVDVAVLDGGVDATHPDLAPHVSRSVQTNAESAAGQPLVTARAVGENHDRYGHGTAVAGRILQTAPNARIWDVGVLAPNNTATGQLVLDALRWAIEERVPLVNLSISVVPRFMSEFHKLADLAHKRGVVVVSSRRNFPTPDNPGIPAATAGVIGVDTGEIPPSELRYQPHNLVEFVAQGKCRVPAPGGGYKDMVGTSFATPFVTGLCALALGAFPGLDSRQLHAWLKELALRWAG